MPAYNAADRIHIPLQALARQTGIVPAFFEIVIVDNASTDCTADTADTLPATQSLRNAGISVRIVREERPGLTHARLRGVAESCGPLICFLDDDTEPGPEYTQTGIAALANPARGLLISSIYPVYAQPPSPAIERFAHHLAINANLGDREIIYPGTPSLAPTVGAGMWVRRSAFLESVPVNNPESLLPDRLGSNLTSCGDTEIGYLIGKAGWERVFVPTLRLGHHIPARRLTTSYLVRLIDASIRSEMTLRQKYFGSAGMAKLRAKSFSRWIRTLLLLPFAMLLQRDGLRETLLKAAQHRAYARGPFR